MMWFACRAKTTLEDEMRFMSSEKTQIYLVISAVFGAMLLSCLEGRAGIFTRSIFCYAPRSGETNLVGGRA